MATKYEMADDSTCKQMQQLVKKMHKPLAEAKVNISVGFAVGEDDEMVVKEGGYEVDGKVTFIPTENRVHGSADVRITLDKHKWEQANVDEREGIMDHMLTQIDVRTKSKTGEVIRDSAGHPKLKRRKFDLRLCEFSSVVEEHGQHAPGAKVAKHLNGVFGQLMLFASSGQEVG